MGWSSGSDVANQVWNTLKEVSISPLERAQIVYALVRALKDQDWDTEDECPWIDDYLCEDEAGYWAIKPELTI